MKVRISKKHMNPNIAGAVGELLGKDGGKMLVNVAGNVWRVSEKQIKQIN